MKTCSKCLVSKPLDDFYKAPTGADGRRGDCKRCILEQRRLRYLADGDVLRARVKKYVQEHPEKAVPYRKNAGAQSRTRNRYLNKTYGITAEQFDTMFADQGSVCAVCGTDDPVRAWTVDHDHLTGKVRGILCWHCNIGLGHLRDDVHTLVAAAAYLIAAAESSEVSRVSA